jgi:hypothetical protein
MIGTTIRSWLYGSFGFEFEMLGKGEGELMLDMVAIGIREGMSRLEGIPTGTDCRPIRNPSDSQVARELVIGRRLLTRLTGADCGYDIERWVGFLDANPSLGLADEFSNPDVWRAWTHFAVGRQRSPEFQKYLALAEQGWTSGLEANVTYESIRNEWLAEAAQSPPYITE